MTDRHILFSAAMVRAILAGRKSQTRRVLNPQPKYGFKPWLDESNGEWMQSGHGEAGDDFLDVSFAAGDRLWAREAFSGLHGYTGTPPKPCDLPRDAAIQYPATYDGWVSRRRSPLHMPRWASRLTLVVSEVRVQRLQDISEEDAIAEGVDRLDSDLVSWFARSDGSGRLIESREVRTWRPAYERIWSSLHGPDAWAENPWVAAHACNIDALPSGDAPRAMEDAHG
jgi:hypothetical protein